MKRLGTVAVALLVLAAASLGSRRATAHPVVIELFQSQGCSSCPPAVANLNAIADRPDVIALSFAVTYWDGLGWKDTFAQASFTARQWDYARALHHSNVFTPQVVVDGVHDGVGAGAGEFARLIHPGEAGTGDPQLTLKPGSVVIGAGSAPAGRADVWLVRYDPRTLRVPIRAGENGGKTLAHRNIVRELVRLGGWTGAPLTLRLPATTDRSLRTAILVQSPGAGPILAAIRG
jgi:hypothetical protein